PAGIAIPGNTLIAQTLALGLNIGLNKNLDSFRLRKTLITEKVGGPCAEANGFGYKDTSSTLTFDSVLVIDIFKQASFAIANATPANKPTAHQLAHIAGFLNEAFEDCRSAVATTTVYPGSHDYEDDDYGENCSSTASNSSLLNEQEARLFQLKAYPNPFTSSVVIGFKAPVAGNVQIEILDYMGRRLEVINKGAVQAGQPTQVEYRANRQTPGQFLYRITVGSHQVTGKLINQKR
ncbi:MAG: T9SS type A sorting domain-containing protein, partial [Chitinophagaceae bacterium]